MKNCCAPDSFKESVSAGRRRGRSRAAFTRFIPMPSASASPIADGGEGTVDALVAATGGRRSVTATGPLGERVAVFTASAATARRR